MQSIQNIEYLVNEEYECNYHLNSTSKISYSL